MYNQSINQSNIPYLNQFDQLNDDVNKANRANDASSMVAAVVVTLAVVVVSLRMILCVYLDRFSCFLKRRSGQTDGRTDGHTLL